LRHTFFVFALHTLGAPRLSVRTKGKTVISERATESPAGIHVLAREFQLSENEVLDFIGSAGRLKMAVRGWVAEDIYSVFFRSPRCGRVSSHREGLRPGLSFGSLAADP